MPRRGSAVRGEPSRPVRQNSRTPPCFTFTVISMASCTLYLSCTKNNPTMNPITTVHKNARRPPYSPSQPLQRLSYSMLPVSRRLLRSARLLRGARLLRSTHLLQLCSTPRTLHEPGRSKRAAQTHCCNTLQSLCTCTRNDSVHLLSSYHDFLPHRHRSSAPMTHIARAAPYDVRL